MKEFIKSVIFKLGYQLNKKKPFFDFIGNKIDLVFDVGAHKGGFAKMIRSDGFLKKIVSFEPQEKEFLELQSLVKKDNNWFLHKRCALGAKNAIQDLNILSETQCSSLLEPNKNSLDFEDNFKKINTQKCEVWSLDYIIENYYNLTENAYLKIDTQGYDRYVLDGCKNNIKKFKFIQIEAGLFSLYENEETYEYYINFFEKIGFTVWDLKPFAYHKSGRLVQFDIIFKNDI